ncbi:MAG: phosphoribosyltransferase [Rhodospirillaceae bacterium]
MAFLDRRQAGAALAKRLEHYMHDGRVVVLALPRGGVPVAYEVAMRLRVPLDILIVRKLGMPGHPEYAMGAIASGGIRIINPETRTLGVPEAVIDAVAIKEQIELERRERAYRGDRAGTRLEDRIVIVVDDGLATGASMRAAVAAVRSRQPRRVVVAVPVGSPDTCATLEQEADEVVCATTPEPFRAVGLWYQDFAQTTDEEVKELLDNAFRSDLSTAER